MSTTILERPPVPETPPQTTTLAALLRRGATYHPQTRFALWRDGATCALGAIFTGFYGPDIVHRPERWDRGLWNALIASAGVDLFEERVVLPTHRYGLLMPLATAIVYLNNEARWTREAIADWLESLGF